MARRVVGGRRWIVVWYESSTGITTADRFKNDAEAEIKLKHLQETKHGWGWMGHVKMEGSSKL